MEKEKNSVVIFIRISPKQNERLVREAKIMGTSRPALMRDSYFKKRELIPNFEAETAKGMLRQLVGMGNNINQISRKVNSGLAVGLYQKELDKIISMFEYFKNLVVSRGNCKAT